MAEQKKRKSCSFGRLSEASIERKRECEHRSNGKVKRSGRKRGDM